MNLFNVWLCNALRDRWVGMLLPTGGLSHLTAKYPHYAPPEDADRVATFGLVWCNPGEVSAPQAKR